MNELVTREVTNHELLYDQLKEQLKIWGVPDDFEVEKEAVGMVLAALTMDDILSVYIDDEKGLCISYSGDDGSIDCDFIPNESV